MADIKFIVYLRENKWILRFFSGAIGLLCGLLLSENNPNVPIGQIQYFLFSSFAFTYLIYFFLAGHAKVIESILSVKAKKVLNFKVLMYWLISLFAWYFIGILILLNFHNAIFALIYIYSLIILMITYPCIASLSIYIPSYQYLKIAVNDKKKKTFVDSLFLATIGLATPWILILFIIFSFITVPFWADYLVIIISYIVAFFVAIDYPYYQSMEEMKAKKIGEFRAQKQSLIDSLNGNNVNQHVAIELKIQRIDREMVTLDSKSSHPYSIMKSVGVFVVVTILGSVLANLLVAFIKANFHLGYALFLMKN